MSKQTEIATNYTDHTVYPPLESDTLKYGPYPHDVLSCEPEKEAIKGALELCGFNVSPTFEVLSRESCVVGLSRRSPIEEPQTPQEAAVEECATKPGLGPDTICLIESDASMGRFYTLMNGRPMTEWFMTRIVNPFSVGDVYIPLLIRRVMKDGEWKPEMVLASELPLVVSKPVTQPTPSKRPKYLACDGDKDAFCPQCEVKHCNCLGCVCVMLPTIGVEDETNKDPLVKQFDTLINQWETNMTNPMGSVPPPIPLRRSPNMSDLHNTIFQAVEKARHERKPMVGIYGSFVCGGYTYYMYNHHRHGWTYISLDINRAIPMTSSLRLALTFVVERQKLYRSSNLMRQFGVDKYVLTREHMRQTFGEDTKGRVEKLCWFGGHQYYLLHTYDDEWWCVCPSLEQAQQHQFI